MIMLTCPNCGKEFPVLPIDSEGFCSCGLDYTLRVFQKALDGEKRSLEVNWKPDPAYPGSGTETYLQTYAIA